MEYVSVMMHMPNKKVTIIGGGEVAHRKAQPFIQAGADITIIAPTLHTGFSAQPITYIQREFQESDISNADIIIAATNCRAVNKKIAALAREKNIPVNSADSCKESSIIFPASVKTDGLYISVSTYGKCPWLAKYISTDINTRYEKYTEEFLYYLGEIRKQLIAEHNPEKENIIEQLARGSLDTLKKVYENSILKTTE